MCQILSYIFTKKILKNCLRFIDLQFIMFLPKNFIRFSYIFVNWLCSFRFIQIWMIQFWTLKICTLDFCWCRFPVHVQYGVKIGFAAMNLRQRVGLRRTHKYDKAMKGFSWAKRVKIHFDIFVVISCQLMRTEYWVTQKFAFRAETEIWTIQFEFGRKQKSRKPKSRIKMTNFI